MHLNTILDEAPVRRFHITLFVVSLLIMILEGIDIQIIGFVAPLIVAEWGIPTADFAIVFSAGLAGATVGAVLLGSLGDRIGRRPMILASMTLFGIGTLMTPFVHEMKTLVLLRFVTSLGLGGVVPNLLALCAELFPRRIRTSFVGIVATAQLAGGVLGSLLSSWLISEHGWRFMFYLAGGLSVLMLVPAFFLLPESLRFLVVKGAAPHRLAALVRRMGLKPVRPEDIVVDRTAPSDRSVLDLFRGGRAPVTSLLWLAIGFNLFMTAFIIYWLPTLLVQLGVELPTAIISITVMNAAGILGGVSLSLAIQRFGPFRVLGAAYLLAAISVAAIGFVAPAILPMMLAVFLAGFLGLGAFAGMSLLAATLYPTELRSAGVGGAIAASKAGAIAGPLAAGAGLAAEMPLTGVFMISASGGLMACLFIFMLSRARAQIREA